MVEGVGRTPPAHDAAPPPPSGAVNGAGAEVCGPLYCEREHLCAQLQHWRARISFLLLYMVLSMVASMAVALSFLAPGHGEAASGVQLEVDLMDRLLLFSHGPFLAILFGFSPELTEPLRRWWRALYERGAPPVRTLPRSFSGIW